MTMDFNKMPPQQTADELRQESEDRVNRLRDDLHSRYREALSHLLPAGKLYKDKFLVGDINGNPGESLDVDLYPGERFGRWKDWGTGDSGGDLIELWKRVKGINFKETLDDIEKYFGSGAVRILPTLSTNTEPAPASKKPLGRFTKKWIYTDAAGNPLAYHNRYDDEESGAKSFRPYDVVRKKWGFPDPRPLYNLQGISDQTHVVLVEGEKTADALIALGFYATTCMGGANAPMDKVDFEPLRGKEVLIWPDNDEPGFQYARNVRDALQGIAKSVHGLNIPPGKPLKWDAADATPEEIMAVLTQAWAFPAFEQPAAVDPSSIKNHAKRRRELWKASAYQGPAPKQEELVRGTIPMGKATLLVAMGDAGKGMLTMHLGLQVAGQHTPGPLDPHPVAFGKDVLQQGEVVIYTAEDDRDEVHRRLDLLDPAGGRFEQGNGLAIVPLPNAGGPFALIRPGPTGPQTTPEFEEIRAELLSAPNLRMVVFDPLSCFVPADLDKDNAVGAYVMGLLASLATETGAAIIVCHHMRKDSTRTPIASLAQARAAIRGTTSLVDGVRAVYCLWPASTDMAKATCKVLDIPFMENRVFCGGVVKSNGPADREIKTFVRQDNGLLLAMNDVLKRKKTPKDDLKDFLVATVAKLAAAGRPLAYSGISGAYERREELPPELQGLGRKRLRDLIRELLDEKKIGKAIGPREKTAKWLDVPGGQFAEGCGRFEPGFGKN
jgi:hypothetical protein